MTRAMEYTLFVSHSWRYSDDYEKLMALLAEAPDFAHRDVSVPKDDPIHNAQTPELLQSALRARIAQCDVVIFIAGKYANYSDWIESELAITKGELGKPLLAVIPWGAVQVPSMIRDSCDLTVAWNTDEIVGAIRELRR